jgi:hypothetical protein
MCVYIVHDRPGVAIGGGSANTAYTIFNSLVGISVMDDLHNLYASSIAIGQPQSVIANHKWLSPNTDGLVLSSLSGNRAVLMSFYSPSGEAAFTRWNSWVAYSPDGTPIALMLQQDRRVPLWLAVVPEPGTLISAGVQTHSVDQLCRPVAGLWLKEDVYSKSLLRAAHGGAGHGKHVLFGVGPV